MAAMENKIETNSDCEKMADKLKSVVISEENSVKSTPCTCSCKGALPVKTETDCSKSTDAPLIKENCASCAQKQTNGFTNGNNSNHNDPPGESRNPESPSTNGSGLATSQEHLYGSCNQSCIDTSSASFFSIPGEETLVASPGSESMVTASECTSSTGSQSSLSSETSNSPSSSVVSTELVSPETRVEHSANTGLVVTSSPSDNSNRHNHESISDLAGGALCENEAPLNHDEQVELATEVVFGETPLDLLKVLQFIDDRSEVCNCFSDEHLKSPEIKCECVLHLADDWYNLCKWIREVHQLIRDEVVVEIVQRDTAASKYAMDTLSKVEEAKLVTRTSETGQKFIEEYQRLKGMQGLPYEFVRSYFPAIDSTQYDKISNLVSKQTGNGEIKVALILTRLMYEFFDQLRVKLIAIIKPDPSLKDVNEFFENLCLSFQQLKYLVQFQHDVDAVNQLEAKLGLITWYSLSVDLFSHVILNDKRIVFYNLVCSEMVRRKMEIHAEHSIQEIEKTDATPNSGGIESLSPTELEACNINLVWWPTVQYIKELAVKESKEQHVHKLAKLVYNTALGELQAVRGAAEEDNGPMKESSCECHHCPSKTPDNSRSNNPHSRAHRPTNPYPLSSGELPADVLREWQSEYGGDLPSSDTLKHLIEEEEGEEDEEGEEEEEEQECQGCAGHHGPPGHSSKASSSRLQANSLPRNKQPNTYRKKIQQNSRGENSVSSKSNSSHNSRGDDYGAGRSISPSSEACTEGADSNCDVGASKHGCNCCYCHKQHNKLPMDGRELYSERQERLLRILEKRLADRKRDDLKRKTAEASSQKKTEDIDTIVNYILTDGNKKKTSKKEAKKEKRKMAADRRKQKQDEDEEASDSIESDNVQGASYKSPKQQKDLAKKFKPDVNARKRDLSESSSSVSRSSSNLQMQESSRSSSSRDGNLENLLDQDGTIAQLRRRAPDVTVTVVKPEQIKHQEMQARGRSTLTKSKEVESRYGGPNQQHPLTSTYTAPSPQMSAFGSGMGGGAPIGGFKQLPQQGETRGLGKLLSGIDKSKEEAPKDTKDQQMVTIRRVMDPVSAEPTVTITVKGQETSDEKLLYKLVNGHTVPNAQVPQQPQRLPLQQQQQMYQNTNVHHQQNIQQQQQQQQQFGVQNMPRPPPHLTPKQKKKWKQQQRKENKKREEMEQEREIEQRKQMEVMQYTQQQIHLKQQEEALRQQTLENQRQQQHLKFMHDAALMNRNHQQMQQMQQQAVAPKGKTGKKGKRKGNNEVPVAYEEPPLGVNVPMGVNITRVPGDPGMVNLSRNHAPHGGYNPHHPMMHQPQIPLNHQMVSGGMVNGHPMVGGVGMHGMNYMQQMPNHNMAGSYHNNPVSNMPMSQSAATEANTTTRKNKKKNKKGKKGKVIEDEHQTDIEEEPEKCVEEPEEEEEEEEEVEELVDIRGWTEEEKIQGVLDGVISKDRLNNKLKRKVNRSIREAAESASKAPEQNKPQKNIKTNHNSETKTTKQKSNPVVTRNSPMILSDGSATEEECVSDGEDLMDHLYNLNIGKKDAFKNLSVAGLSISCAAKDEASSNSSSRSRDVSVAKKGDTVKKSSSKGSMNENVATSNKKQQQQTTKDNKSKPNNEKNKPTLPKKTPVITKKEENKSNVAKKKDSNVNQNRNSSFVPVKESSIATTVPTSNRVQKKKNDSKAATKNNTENVKNKPENDGSKNTQKKKTPSESSSSSKSSNKQQTDNRQGQQPKSHQSTHQQNNQPQKQQSNQHAQQHQSAKSTQSHQTPNIGENKTHQQQDVDLNIYRSSGPSVLQECMAKSVSEQLAARNRLSGMINNPVQQKPPMNFMPPPQPSPFNMQPQQQQQMATGHQNSMNRVNNRLGTFSPSIGEPGGYANSFGSLFHNSPNTNFGYNGNSNLSNNSVFNGNNNATGSSTFGNLGSSFGVANNTAGRYNNLDGFRNSQFQPDGQFNYQSLTNMSTNLGIPNTPTGFSSSVGVDSSNQLNRFFTNQNVGHGGMGEAPSSRSYGGLMTNSLDSSSFMRSGLNPGQAADFGLPYGASSIRDGNMELPKKDVGVIGKKPRKNRRMEEMSAASTIDTSMSNSVNLMNNGINYSNFGYPSFNSSYQNDPSNQ